MSKNFDELVSIMTKLRAPDGGCPWDLEQNHKTLKPYLLEEAHEVIDAIDNCADGADSSELCSELGDLLLQVIFHSQIAAEQGDFDINDVCSAINEKLIRRHPHVFGETIAKTSSEVLSNWEKIKQKEKAHKNRESILDGLPHSLPALLQAKRVSEKCGRVGFEWDDVSGAVKKLDEEIAEFKEEVKREMDGENRREAMEEEMGDMLFCMANVACYLDIDPESALKRSIKKFRFRFAYIEKALKKENLSMEEASLDTMEKLWNMAKEEELET